MIGTGIFLCLAAFLTGLIDSVAGGGGLIMVPALLVAGLPTQTALGVNKFVGTLGTSAALMNFARSGLVLWRPARVGIPFALIGAAVGSRCVLAFDSATAGKIVIALLPFAALATLLPRRHVASREEISARALYALTPLICLGVGFYDGFFGPGAGSFYILAFHFITRMDLIRASATAKVLNLASNAGAFVVFLLNGQVLFFYAVPLAVVNILGNLAGSQLAIRIGPGIVRRFLLVSLLILFGTLIWRFYLQDVFAASPAPSGS